MSKIRCLIVDDEEPARKLLANFVGRLPMLEQVDACRNPMEASEVLREKPVDLLFLDIQMPGLTGLEFLRSLQRPPAVIFTTAYPDYAIEGYQLDVIDYLLKPFSFERFHQAVQKAAERLKLIAAARGEAGQEYLAVKSEHKVYKLRFSDIRYIEGMREYVAFHTREGRILSLLSLKKLEEELPSDRFLRVHKSFIVAMEEVRALDGNRLDLGGEVFIPIGGSYREEVKGRLFGV